MLAERKSVARWGFGRWNGMEHQIILYMDGYVRKREERKKKKKGNTDHKKSWLHNSKVRWRYAQRMQRAKKRKKKKKKEVCFFLHFVFGSDCGLSSVTYLGHFGVAKLSTLLLFCFFLYSFYLFLFSHALWIFFHLPINHQFLIIAPTFCTGRHLLYHSNWLASPHSHSGVIIKKLCCCTICAAGAVIWRSAWK